MQVILEQIFRSNWSLQKKNKGGDYVEDASVEEGAKVRGASPSIAKASVAHTQHTRKHA